MAKKAQKKAFSFTGFDVNSYKQTENYTRAVDTLYASAVSDFARLAKNLSVSPDKPFSFNDYPGAKKKAESIVKGLAANITTVINRGSENQWLYACKKNDAFLNSILDTSKVSRRLLEKYQDKNLDALKTFQTRKINGMGLSQRVWNYTGQMKTQMELGIDIALGDGRSADALSRDLRQYLVDPDKLFRRVRDKHGNLVLSKNAKAFHPGQGKYRSSYKNAMRLTRSEINMSYRESDQLRWEQLDFVIGYEVKLSNNHTLNGVPFVDICDDLAGKYPKTFKFKGWHPQCRCHAVPIFQDRDEFNDNQADELKAALNGDEYKRYESQKTIKDVPDNFKNWIKDNAEKAKGWKSQPYFIRDNFKGGNISGGLNIGSTNVATKVAANKVKLTTKEVYDKISKVENEIRKNKSFETAVVFNELGEEVFRKKGGKTSVSFTPSELGFFENNIFTHNHPRGWKAKADSLRRIGNSFSPADVMIAVKSNMAEIRAVTPHYTFTMKRPAGGWPLKGETLQREINLEHFDITQKLKSVISRMPQSHINTSIERAETIHFHLVWKSFCEKHGIEYSKSNTL